MLRLDVGMGVGRLKKGLGLCVGVLAAVATPPDTLLALGVGHLISVGELFFVGSERAFPFMPLRIGKVRRGLA